MNKSDFTFSTETIGALQVFTTRGYQALAMACFEGAAADLTVKALGDAIRQVSNLSCGQGALAAGLKAGKNGSNVTAIERTMVDAAAEHAQKVADKAKKDKEEKAARQKAHDVEKAKALLLAVEGTEVEKAHVVYINAERATINARNVLAKAQEAYDNAVKAENAAREAREAAKKAENDAKQLATTAATTTTAEKVA